MELLVMTLLLCGAWTFFVVAYGGLWVLFRHKDLKSLLIEATLNKPELSKETLKAAKHVKPFSCIAATITMLIIIALVA